MSTGEVTIDSQPKEKVTRWRRLFRETNTPLETFPELFLMQTLTGGFGATISFVWMIRILTINPNVVAQLWYVPALIIITFLGMLFVSILPLMDGSSDFAKNIRFPSSLEPEQRRTLEVRVRLLVALLSATYAIATAALLWFSGGARSPFVPFFVMTYTLTISYIKDVRSFWAILGYYLLIVTVACYAASYHPPPTTPSTLWAHILEDEVSTVIHWGFIALSLFVPTLGSWLVERRSRRRLAADAQPRTV